MAEVTDVEELKKIFLEPGIWVKGVDFESVFNKPLCYVAPEDQPTIARIGKLSDVHQGLEYDHVWIFMDYPDDNAVIGKLEIDFHTPIKERLALFFRLKYDAGSVQIAREILSKGGFVINGGPKLPKITISPLILGFDRPLIFDAFMDVITKLEAGIQRNKGKYTRRPKKK